jgi:hydrogenase/urease accessory protein HupE
MQEGKTGLRESARRASARSVLAIMTLICWLPTPAFGHPEGFSGLHVTITAERVRAAITLHTRDLGMWFPPGKYPDYVADVTREMEKTVGEIVELRIDEQPLPVAGVNAFLQEVGLIEIDVDYKLPASAEPVELLIWSKHLIHLPRGHQQLLFVEDRRGIALAAEHGVMRLEDVLTAERDAGGVWLPVHEGPPRPRTEPLKPPLDGATSKDQPAGAPAADATGRGPKTLPSAAGEHRSSRISFFLFGVEHIITGYDHLLFLAALLLTCASFKEAATIITCFTVAHSITLALAALDVVRLPASIVEPAIALSIVYVAIDNLFGAPALWRRAAITCFFGLIHGLGFASALRDIGLGTIPGGVFWPLLKFNLGVEAGQLCVAAALLPLLLVARRSEHLTKRLVPAGSILVALLGGYWLVTRVVSQFVSG